MIKGSKANTSSPKRMSRVHQDPNPKEREKTGLQIVPTKAEEAARRGSRSSQVSHQTVKTERSYSQNGLIRTKKTMRSAKHSIDHQEDRIISSDLLIGNAQKGILNRTSLEDSFSGGAVRTGQDIYSIISSYKLKFKIRKFINSLYTRMQKKLTKVHFDLINDEVAITRPPCSAFPPPRAH